MERVFQKAMLSDVTSDRDYLFVGFCSGHGAYSTKAWLKGFYLVDETIDTSKLTNAELTNILDPNSDEFRDLVNFVYDTALFDYCPDSDKWFI